MTSADQLTSLTSAFAEGEILFERLEEFRPELTPEPYKGLLVHAHHMTTTMEKFHHSPVVVEVLDRRLDGDLYSRKIFYDEATMAARFSSP